MRKPSEMYTVSRIQNMVQTHKKNAYFVSNLFVYFLKKKIGLSALRAPHGGAILEIRKIICLKNNTDMFKTEKYYLPTCTVDPEKDVRSEPL